MSHRNRKHMLAAILAISTTAAAFAGPAAAADTPSAQTEKSASHRVEGRKARTLDDAKTAYDYFADEDGQETLNYDSDRPAYQLKRLIVVTGKDLKDTRGAVRSAYYEDMGAWILDYDSQADTEAAAVYLKKQFGSSAVFPDRLLKSEAASSSAQAAGSSYVSWGTDAMRLDQLRDRANADPTLTSSVTVAVLDSGINSSHEMFADREILSGSRGVVTVPELFKSYYTNNYEDDFGHGTHVAGIVADGTSDQVKFLILKILDSNGEGTAMDLYAALDYIAEEYSDKVDVINISGGIDGILPGSAGYRMLERKMKEVRQAGILVVTAAGNGDSETGKAQNIAQSGTYPADSRYAYAVGAVNRKQVRASFSNYGSTLDFAAPGVDIRSAYIGGNRRYVTDTGTSMASPHVAAAAAMIRLYHPKYSVSKVASLMEKYARDLGTAGKDSYYGYGQIEMPVGKTQTITTSRNSYQVKQENTSSFSLNASAKTKIRYGSSNKSVIKVTQKGTVKIVGKGTASVIIKARSSLNYSYTKKTVKVTVS